MSGFYNYPSSGPGVSVSRTGHSINEMFQCMWDCGHGLHCCAIIRGHSLSDHLREAHGIYGSDKTRFWCLWNSCNRESNKDSLVRHIKETHMGIMYVCGCGSTFSRRDTLNKHNQTCPTSAPFSRRDTLNC
ncbi:hypothetical protein BDR03DRAFT_961694 [Suillus americanus]|nr:hypothetical protein BDR03DRAFT_961694 [Suillus americanus]